jgi:hypothetical protein
MAQAWGHPRITVNAIAPGGMASPTLLLDICTRIGLHGGHDTSSSVTCRALLITAQYAAWEYPRMHTLNPIECDIVHSTTVYLTGKLTIAPQVGVVDAFATDLRQITSPICHAVIDDTS